jgi:hypothetical protein
MAAAEATLRALHAEVEKIKTTIVKITEGPVQADDIKVMLGLLPPPRKD